MSADCAFSFGPFCLLPGQRKLLEDGQPVRLGSRAFDILVALVDRAGEVVSNGDLMGHVWPSTVVEPCALRVHMAGLRKVLGDGRAGQRYVVNVPLQGYCFVAPVTKSNAPTATAPPSTPAVPPTSVSAAQPEALALPAQLTRMIGRDEAIAEVLCALAQRRCITLVGPGGMGKTTLALAAASAAARTFDGQVAFVNLAPLRDPTQVVGAVSSALGLATLAADPLRGLLCHLRERRMLIVLDNCEHLIEVSAGVADALLSGASGVHLLVTSREPLRIQGEWVQRLASLAVPAPLALPTAQEALRVPSVELFVERARACVDTFEFTDADVPAVAEICRALDGIPLALELAAAGVERLGVRGVASHLGDRLSLLTRGRRTALPRHQTLRAALDWGYALLTPSEQSLLRCLSIFRGRFTAESARAVCGAAEPSAVDEDLFNLASKSFVVSDISGDAVHYWLLETTREYAAMLRDASGETADVARRHATHMLEVADASDREREARPAGEWRVGHAHLIDDYRAALDWSLAPGGLARLGAELAGASAPLWFALSAMAEYLGIAERALAAVRAGVVIDPRREMALCEAYGNAWWHMRGTGAQAEAAFQRALDLALLAGSRADTMRSLWGLWLVACSSGAYTRAASLAERYGEVTAGSKDPAATLVHHRMMALSLHYVGRHAEARRHVQKVLDHPVTSHAAARNSGFHFDQRVAGLTFLTRILWMLGLTDQARASAEQAVVRALEIDHSLSLCFALSMACTPVAIWAGDWVRAARFTRLLQERTTKYSLQYWHAFGQGFGLVLRRRDGSAEGLDTLAHPPTWMSLKDLLCTCDAGLADDAALARGDDEAAGWCGPELLRLRGQREREAGRSQAASALFQRGMALARQHQALSWELRCATSLAGLLEEAGAAPEARATLAPVVQRFTEGFDSADLRHASALLTRLA